MADEPKQPSTVFQDDFLDWASRNDQQSPPPAEVSPNDALILPCGGTKDPASCAMEAYKRYVGPTWNETRKALGGEGFPRYQDKSQNIPQALKNMGVDMYVLSAEYGLIPADTLIENYDRRMTPDRREEIKADKNLSQTISDTLSKYNPEKVHLGTPKDYTKLITDVMGKNYQSVFPEGSGQGSQKKGIVDFLKLRLLKDVTKATGQELIPFGEDPGQITLPMGEKKSKEGVASKMWKGIGSLARQRVPIMEIISAAQGTWNQMDPKTQQEITNFMQTPFYELLGMEKEGIDYFRGLVGLPPGGITDVVDDPMGDMSRQLDLVKDTVLEEDYQLEKMYLDLKLTPEDREDVQNIKKLNKGLTELESLNLWRRRQPSVVRDFSGNAFPNPQELSHEEWQRTAPKKELDKFTKDKVKNEGIGGLFDFDFGEGSSGAQRKKQLEDFERRRRQGIMAKAENPVETKQVKRFGQTVDKQYKLPSDPLFEVSNVDLEESIRPRGGRTSKNYKYRELMGDDPKLLSENLPRGYSEKDLEWLREKGLTYEQGPKAVKPEQAGYLTVDRPVEKPEYDYTPAGQYKMETNSLEGSFLKQGKGDELGIKYAPHKDEGRPDNPIVFLESSTKIKDNLLEKAERGELYRAKNTGAKSIYSKEYMNIPALKKEAQELISYQEGVIDSYKRNLKNIDERLERMTTNPTLYGLDLTEVEDDIKAYKNFSIPNINKRVGDLGDEVEHLQRFINGESIYTKKMYDEDSIKQRAELEAAGVEIIPFHKRNSNLISYRQGLRKFLSGMKGHNQGPPMDEDSEFPKTHNQGPPMDEEDQGVKVKLRGMSKEPNPFIESVASVYPEESLPFGENKLGEGTSRFNFNDKGWVTLRKTESPNTAKIESIQAFEPGKGFGNEVMQALVKKADETGVTLTGNVEPFGNEERMSKEQLEEFYKRFGFQVYEEGDITRAVRLVPVKVKLQGFKRKY